MDFNRIRHLYKTAKQEVLDSITIKYVDGAEVRKKEIDFCIGGHFYRYPDLVPENEVWIEEVYKDKLDMTADLIHELVERSLMKHLKVDYEAAHDLANVAEKSIRKAKLSKRAAMESSSTGINVAITVRKKWREYYKNKNVPTMQLMDNKTLNETIAGDFAKSQVLHRFLLNSGDVGEFRKSNTWVYLSAFRGGKYDILTIQPSIKAVDPELSKRRLTKEWLESGYRRLLERVTRPGA
jgi:hypothetical protein